MNYRAIEENMKQVAEWVSGLTGEDVRMTYEQRRDADWATARVCGDRGEGRYGRKALSDAAGAVFAGERGAQCRSG